MTDQGQRIPRTSYRAVWGALCCSEWHRWHHRCSLCTRWRSVTPGRRGHLSGPLGCSWSTYKNNLINSGLINFIHSGHFYITMHGFQNIIILYKILRKHTLYAIFQSWRNCLLYLIISKRKMHIKKNKGFKHFTVYNLYDNSVIVS